MAVIPGYISVCGGMQQGYVSLARWAGTSDRVEIVPSQWHLVIQAFGFFVFMQDAAESCIPASLPLEMSVPRGTRGLSGCARYLKEYSSYREWVKFWVQK